MPHIACSHAIGDMKDRPPTPPVLPVREKQTCVVNDTESDGDDSLDTHPSPPKPKHGQLTARMGEEPVSHAAGMAAPKAIVVRGRVLLPRSPQPAQAKQNTHPGIVAMPRAKKTSAEANAFAMHRANLQQQSDDQDCRHIETLAKMELQEELDEEAEAQSVIKRLDDASFVDDIDDVEMQSDDEDTDESSKVTSDSELDRAVVVRKAAPKTKKVCCLVTSVFEHDY
jgi:hypothetical protein